MRILLIAILLLFFHMVEGQENDYFTYTTNGELHNGTINDIVQDSLGKLWLATPDGLMHFDGYTTIKYTTSYSDEFSLPSRRVIKLSYLASNELWISTARGLCRYDSEMDRFIPYTFYGISEPPIVRDPLHERNGRKYIRVLGRLYTHSGNRLEHNVFHQVTILDEETIPYDKYIRNVYADPEHVLISYRIRDDKDEIMSQVFEANIINDTILKIGKNSAFELHGNILDVKLKSGKAYIASDEGLYIFDFNNGLIQPVEGTSEMRVSSVLPASDRGIWFGTALNGLGRYNERTGEHQFYSHDPNRLNTILGNNIFSLCEDFSGMLMIGHGGEGMSSVNLNKKMFLSFKSNPQKPNSLGDNTVMCFNQFKEDILVGTRNNGLQRMIYREKNEDVSFEKIEIPDSLYAESNAEAIWTIYQEEENQFWLGTVFGLIKAEYTVDGWKFEKFLGNNTVRSIFLDSEGNIWAGSYKGLYFFPNEQRDSMEAILIQHNENDPSSLPDNIITGILLDKQDRLWVATENGGVVKLSGRYSDVIEMFNDTKGNPFSFKRVESSNKLLDFAEVSNMIQQDDGTIWFPTKGNGLIYYHPDSGVVSQITVMDGLPGMNVFGIIPDYLGNIWLSTNKGLSKYNQDRNEFRNYTPSDGIQGNVFMVNASFKDKKSRIYFGGRNGFTVFYPEAIKDNEIPPKFHFKGVSMRGEKIGIGDTVSNKVILPKAMFALESLTIPYNERNFNILFSSIHFQHPPENKVEYFLKGFHQVPVTISASSEGMIFTNVENGTYELMVRAVNSDNWWTRDQSRLIITVLPPWYRTSLARVLFVVTAILIIVLITRMLLRGQALKHQLNIEKIEKENIAELNEAKLRFFTNISHEFRTPLSLTLGPIENILKEYKGGDIKLRKQLELASRNARILLRLIDQIIDFRRLDAGKIKLKAYEVDIVNLFDSVLKNFQSIITDKEVELFVNYPDDAVHLWLDPPKVEQIFYNLLSNALKYVPDSGSVAVSVSRLNQIPQRPELDGKWCCVSIYNDGKQIPEEGLEKVFERFYKVDHSQLGSGIGLAFAKSLVDLHKGFITVENTQTTGVTFNVYFQRGNQHLNEDEISINAYAENFLKGKELILQKEEARNKIKAYDHEYSILVVEDNRELREFFKMVLSDDFDIYEAENGVLGLDKAKEIVPDIIITDLLMPEMNGFELCKALKEASETSHIPVIMLTAVNTSEDMITGYKVGADAYVVKPFDISVLEAQINHMIENRKRLQSIIMGIEESDKESQAVVSREEYFIKNIREIIEESMSDPELNVNNLAERINLSSTQLYRKIKAITGQSTVDYIRDIRLEKAAQLLASMRYSVKEVCFETGFNSPSYFVKCFKKKYGVTPKEYTDNVAT